MARADAAADDDGDDARLRCDAHASARRCSWYADSQPILGSADSRGSSTTAVAETESLG
jgi:hypothetical protein